MGHCPGTEWELPEITVNLNNCPKKGFFFFFFADWIKYREEYLIHLIRKFQGYFLLQGGEVSQIGEHFVSFKKCQILASMIKIGD